MAEIPPPPAPDLSETPDEARRRAKAEKAYRKASRPWYQKKRFIIPGLLVGFFMFLIIIAAIGAGLGDEEPTTEAGTESPPEAESSEPEAAAPPTARATTEAEEAPEDTAPPPTDPSPEAEEEPVSPGAAGVGQRVNDGKFEFVVESLECGANEVGGELFNETAQGHFCLLELTVTNTGDESQTMSDSNQYLYDAEGREFSSDSIATLWANEESSSFFLEEINPGNSVTGVVVFDVPVDAVIVAAELHDSFLSGGVTVEFVPSS